MKTPLDDIIDSSCWWTALRLDERRATQPSAGAGPARERGRRRLSSWRADKRVTGGLDVEFTRWQQLGIDEDELVLLLGETPEDLRSRLPRRPEWLAALDAAYRSARPDHTRPNPGLLELIRPLGEYFDRQLRAQLTGLAAEHGTTIADDHPLLRPDTNTLTGMITPTLVREMHAANARGELTGSTPQERFASFTRSLTDPATALAILARHPVLARELVGELAAWVRVRSTVASRLVADLPALRAAYDLPEAALHTLVDITFGAGDTHRGGQSVAILVFPGDRKVVYKPRSLAVEQHFQELLDWLNPRGVDHPLRTLRILERDGYGWAEFVTAAPCTTEAEVARFFWRQGAFLAVLYALRTQDIHLENLIAAGEHPVFIDMEASLQSPLPLAMTVASALPAAAIRMVHESVIGVGLLPQQAVQQSNGEVRALDMSGLSGAPAQTLMAVPHWVGQGTDEMRMARGHLPMSGGQNLTGLAERPVDPTAFRAELRAGFEQVYRILLRDKQELTAPRGPLTAFADDEVRPILRGTMIYGRLLLESWHPDVLADALDRACLFELLAKGHEQTPARWQVVGSEVRQILHRDVPFFATTVSSRHLYDDNGVLVEDFFTASGAQAIRDRAAQLSEEDLRRQLWCIDASLNAAQIGEETRGYTLVTRPLPDRVIDLGTAVEAARVLGDRLVDNALRESGTDRPLWLSLTMVADRYWNVAPTGFESFTGINGILLFLAQLESFTTDPRIRRDVETLADMLVEQVDTWLTMREGTRAALGIGAFRELGSAVYTLAHLSALWKSDELAGTAARLVPEMVSRFADDRTLDVVGGTAGAALAILALHEVRPDERTEQALAAAGRTIVDAAEQYPDGIAWTTTLGSYSPLLGYSHGASGMAVALSRIAEVTGQSRFADAAAQAVRYEHARFDAAEGNWPDERDFNPRGTFMNAWCHGAAGIGLARSELLGVVDDPAVAADLEAAVGKVRRDLLGDLPDGATVLGTANDSLCHGDLGLAETLLSAGQALGAPQLVDEAGRVARAVAQSVLAGTERCGVPRGIHTPGLMMGIAGIGYGLLRFAAPDRVPNVLALRATATATATATASVTV